MNTIASRDQVRQHGRILSTGEFEGAAAPSAAAPSAAPSSPSRSPWYREPSENDYYSSVQVEDLDVAAERAAIAAKTTTANATAAEVGPMLLPPPNFSATPNARVLHDLLNSFIQSVSMSHPIVTAFDGMWSFLYRYITRSKVYVDLYDPENPPWKEHAESLALMASSVGGATGKGNDTATASTTTTTTTGAMAMSLAFLASELAPFRALSHNALKANSLWYNHQRSILTSERPTFSYTKFTVEVHFDQLKPYPPGTSPLDATAASSTHAQTDASTRSFIEEHGADYFSAVPTPQSSFSVTDPDAFVPQVMSAEDAMSKGIDLQGEMWARGHRILVRREITERFIRPGVIIEESSRAYPTQLMAKEFPQGEHFMVGAFREMIGSTTSPSVPANITNPRRLAQLAKISTPRTAEEVRVPGGWMVVNGKGRFPSMYLSRLEHSLLLCKSAGNGKPMGVIHFDNPLTGSRDNVMIRIGSAKSIVYKKDEVSLVGSTALAHKSKTKIGTSGTRSVLGFLERERTVRPNYSFHVMDLTTSVAVANKYVPGHGNSCGLDARYQSSRILAGQQHMLSFRRKAAGLTTPAMSHTDIDPYDHTDIKNEEITCTKTDKERIAKIEKTVSVNTRATEVILIQLYIQRIMILLPVVEVYLGLGTVTRAALHERIGLADDQIDDDEGEGAAAPSNSPAAGAVGAAGAATPAVSVEDGMDHDEDDDDGGPSDPMEMQDEWGGRRAPGVPYGQSTPMAMLDCIEADEAEEEARAQGLPCTPAPVPHKPPTALFEKRKLYANIIDRSFDMYEMIPEDQRQTVAITHLGELYGANIQMEHRTRTPYEYGLYFLDQCCLSMQGMLTKLREDFDNDVPIVQAIRQGADGSFRGSHTLHTTVFDEKTKIAFWAKSMSLSINIVNPYLRDWCGFRGAQHGQHNSLDEHSIDSVADIHKFHFRNGFREVKGAMLNDLKRDLSTLFLPFQQWFDPANACTQMKQDTAVDQVKLGHAIGQGHNNEQPRGGGGGGGGGGADGDDESMQFVSAATTATVAAAGAAAVGTAAGGHHHHHHRVHFPTFMQRLANEYPTVAPVTAIMRKLTTKYEEDTRRGGTATFQLYQPFNATNVFTGPRRVVAIADTRAGSFSRQFKNNFQSMFCYYGTTANDSSGQNNTLSTTATVSRALTQQEHVTVYDFVQRLKALRWLWAAESDVYRFCLFGMPMGSSEDGGDNGCGGGVDVVSSRGLWRHASKRHFYSLIYGTDFLGWFHRDDFERVYNAWWMFKTHPNATDGIRFLSLETIHVKRELRIHMNPGRPTRLVWVVDVKEKQLRATRVSRRLRTLFETHPDKLRAEDRMTLMQQFEEIMLHRCVEWMDYFQARHFPVASSMAAFVDSRARSDLVYGAVEFHPAGALEPTALAIPVIEHNGGTRTHAATQMARAFTGHESGSFATNGEMKSPFTLVYPHRPMLLTAGPVGESKDGMQALVAWVNDPHTDQDSSIQAYAAADLGAGMVMMNETVKVVHDTTRTQAEVQLRVMSATSLALPTQVAKQQAQATLTRQIQHDALQRSRQVSSLMMTSPHAATAIFESLHAEQRARQETIRQHMLGWHTASLAGGGGSGGTGAHLGGTSANRNYVPLDPSMNASMVDPNPRDPLATSLVTQAQMSQFQATYLFEKDALPVNSTELHTLFGKMEPLKSGIRVETAHSAGPMFDWQTYCSVTGQSRNTLETDMFIDTTNTVSFPAIVTTGMTLIRSAVLTPALVQLYEHRALVEQENRRRQDYFLRRKIDPSKMMLLHGDAVFAAASSSSSSASQFFMRPLEELPPVEYHRRSLRTKKPYMEVTAFRWTLGEYDRHHINIALAHLHQFAEGDKFTNDNGQKSVGSIFKAIYQHPFSASDEYPGMHAQIQRAAQNQPTRRTVADHISIVAASMACTDPSRKLYSTYDTYQQMPLFFNEMMSELDRRYNDVLQFNPHMLERMETKKNHSRFAGAGGSGAAMAVARTFDTSSGYGVVAGVDPFVMHQFREQTVCRTTAAILQVNEWWADVDYSETVERRWLALCGHKAGMHLPPTPDVDALISRRGDFPLIQGGVGGGGATSAPSAPSASFLPGSGSPAACMRDWSTDERLRWLWWKDVYDECGQTMHMGDAFWVDMMHDMTVLAREINQMHALRDDIDTLGKIITHDLCMNMTQHAQQQKQQHTIHHNQQRSHHGRNHHHHHHHPSRSYPESAQQHQQQPPMTTEAMMQQNRAQLLHQMPEQYPATYADQKRTFDALCLSLLKATHRVALVWAAALPQVERLERMYVHTRDTLATSSDVWRVAHTRGAAAAYAQLEDFFNTMRAFCATIRAYSEAHQLQPTHLITHAHVQRYVYGAVHVILDESYREMHVVLRPPPPHPNEPDTMHDDQFWTQDTWQLWTRAVDTVHAVAIDEGGEGAPAPSNSPDGASAPSNSPEDPEEDRWYDPSTVADDPVARRTYGYQRGGMLAAARDYWHRCWAADFLARLRMHGLPLSLAYRPPGEYERAGALSSLLRSKHESLHYLPSTVPQLLQVARLLVLARTNAVDDEDAVATSSTSDAEKELSLYARALQVETEHVMNAVPEQAIDGETGCALLGGMWIGVSSENVLHKFAQDLIKINDGKGPVHVVSGQPADTNDGKGAGRWGKMEVSAASGAGSARVVRAVTCDQSDSHDADICEHCGRPSSYNHLTKQGWCATCNKPARGLQHTVYANTVINTVCGVAGIVRVADLDHTINPQTFDRLN